jgi:carboxymethylenebutenolidase
VKALAALLTGPEHGHTKLGAIGSVAPAFLAVCSPGLTGAHRYCYGGRLVADCDQAGLLACGVYAHPSLMKKADLDKLSAPASFALAESDGAFDSSLIAHAKTALNGRIANELVVYPGTCHGFACRGDLNIESVRQGVEGAHAQAVDWFRMYLL